MPWGLTRDEARRAVPALALASGGHPQPPVRRANRLGVLERHDTIDLDALALGIEQHGARLQIGERRPDERDPSGSSLMLISARAASPQPASGTGSGVTNQYRASAIPRLQPRRAVAMASS